MMKKRYLIFGSGFIGGHYADHLLSNKSDVKVIYHSKLNPNLPLSIQKKDGRHIKEIKKVISEFQPTYVLLTQGLSFIPDNDKDLERSINGNLTAPLKVLEAIYLLKKNQDNFHLPKKIITFGSAAEYGNSNGKPFTETSPSNPASLYGLTKNWLYQASQSYYRLGLPTVHLRQFNAIGAGQDPFFVISSFCRQISLMEKGKQKEVLNVGNLNQKRDFIDVRDAARAYDVILKRSKSGEAVNVCSGKSYYITEAVDQLRKLTNIKFSIHTDPKLLKTNKTRSNMVIGRPVILKKLGWKPKYTLAETLQWTLDYWRNQIR